MGLFKPWTWFGRLESKLFGDGGITGFTRSIINQYSRNELTGAEQQQNEFNAAQAQQQMDFQREMSNTAYQRQTADMQAAGVNPALMYGGAGSSGASTPSGSAATGSAMSGLGMSDLMSAILGASKMKKEIALLEAEREESVSRKNKNEAETENTVRNTAWIDKLNQGQLDEIASRMDVNSATINEKDYLNALTKARELNIEKETSWIDKIRESEEGANRARAARDNAEAAISRMEKELGHRLSSSEWLALVDTLLAAFDLGTPNDVLSGLREAWNNRIVKPKNKVSEGMPGATVENPSKTFERNARRAAQYRNNGGAR